MDGRLIIGLILIVGIIFFFVFLAKAITVWLFDIEKTQKIMEEQRDLLQHILGRLDKRNETTSAEVHEKTK